MARERKHWYCANKSCGKILGTVTDNKLVVNLDNVVTVNTDGTSLVLTCDCMHVKVWYPTSEDAILGAFNSIRREIRQDSRR